MRIGTWNLAGRWTPTHLEFLSDLDCDVLLLTEVADRVTLPDHELHVGEAAMMPGRHWAGVATRAPARALPDPHPASVAVSSGGLVWCSSLLPWRGSGGLPPWHGDRHEDRARTALVELLAHLPRTDLVWGGDWNHALSGREQAGSAGGRRALLDSVESLRLQVPTAALPHRVGGRLSVDHVAVPRRARVTSATRVPASAAGRRLSDHDAYVVELA